MAPKAKKGDAKTRPAAQSGSARERNEAFQKTKSSKGKGCSTDQPVGSSAKGKAAQRVDPTSSFTPALEKDAFLMLWEAAKKECDGSP
ncbi:hypothetical protein OPQ81_000612 [Rhizoctonia solani]|nr:hypothetical protein OPQ81_000612 [Rhizoctonia solani]